MDVNENTGDLAVQPSGNIPSYSVAQLAKSLRSIVEENFGRVQLRGEISGYRGAASSGNVYFSLVEGQVKVDAIVWRAKFAHLSFKPEEGAEVVATGKITIYPNRSSYQIVIDELELAGQGAIMAMLEQRRLKLAGEGLFDASHKLALPRMPRRIGLITSEMGAVIRDILHRLSDRMPCHVLVVPVAVQGRESPGEITSAVNAFNRLAHDSPYRPEAIVIARGGGSLEDMIGFNDEDLVRAVFASKIPVVSAIGHETDWCLLDHVADVRAPTPTAAAEFLTPVRDDLLARLEQLSLVAENSLASVMGKVRQGINRITSPVKLFDEFRYQLEQRLDNSSGLLQLHGDALGRQAHARLQSVGSDLYRFRPAEKFLQQKHALATSATRLEQSVQQQRVVWRDRLNHADQLDIKNLQNTMEHFSNRLGVHHQDISRGLGEILRDKVRHLATQAKLLDAVSFKAVLQRGFAIVRDEDKRLLRSSAMISSGQLLRIVFGDGEIGARSVGAIAGPKKASTASEEASSHSEETGSHNETSKQRSEKIKQRSEKIKPRRDGTKDGKPDASVNFDLFE